MISLTRAYAYTINLVCQSVLLCLPYATASESEIMEADAAGWCTSPDCPISHLQHKQGVYRYKDNPPPDGLPYPRFGLGNPPPSIWAARSRIVSNECTNVDLSKVAAFNYYHGRLDGSGVSREQKPARQVLFDLGKNVAFEAPQFEELAVPERPIRAPVRRPRLKLRVRERTLEEQRIEKRRMEEEWLEAQERKEQRSKDKRRLVQQADDQFDEQRGDPVNELLSPDTLKAVAGECGQVPNARVVEEDVSDVDLD